MNESKMNFNLIFNCSNAKVLDLVQIVGNMPVTIPMLSDATELSYKTVGTVVKRFVKLKLMVETTKIRNARAYSFQTEELRHLKLLR